MNGVATFATSMLTAGSHTITTTYNGDNTLGGSTGSLNSNPQVVNKAATNTAFGIVHAPQSRALICTNGRVTEWALRSAEFLLASRTAGIKTGAPRPNCSAKTRPGGLLLILLKHAEPARKP